jgi:signal transduction histidine kinase
MARRSDGAGAGSVGQAVARGRLRSALPRYLIRARAMLRTRLAVAFFGLLGPALIMAFLLYWGPRQMEQRLERTLLAHGEVQAYLELALDAYRHLQQLSYDAMLGQPVDRATLQAGLDRLSDRLDHLRRLTLDELAFVGQSEPEERLELARIARFERLLEQAVAALSQPATDAAVLRQEMDLLDRELGTLVDDVIEDELSEAAAADSQARELTRRLTLLAVAAVAITAVCAGLTALWVRRRIQHPIDALVEGTRQIGGGGLDHRVRVSGRDELAYLALSFNWMAAELERRRAELEGARTDLERKVQDRTRELERSNHTLREVDQARRRAFADISHALRTPLTVIRGEAEVTLRAPAGEADSYRAALTRIVETAAQLSRLVEELLEVARSEAVALRLQVGEVTATGLVRDAGEDAKVLAAAKGIRISCEVPQGEIGVRGDADRLHELLLVLLDNACRYTPAGGNVALSLAAHPPHAVVTVRDSGIGIAPDDLALVPARYYRGANAPQIAPAGAGLGLHVAQAIVDAHGGDLAIESEVGRGTTVRVRLPLAEPADVTRERAAG